MEFLRTVWNWLAHHAAIISAIGSVAMVIIWLAHLQLFYTAQRRRRRAHLVIQHTDQLRFDAPCLLANMSQEAVFVICAMMVFKTDHGPSVRPISNLTHTEDASGGFLDHSPDGSHTHSHSDDSLQQSLRQGTLDSGNLLNLGSFADALRDGGDESGPPPCRYIRR